MPHTYLNMYIHINSYEGNYILKYFAYLWYWILRSPLSTSNIVSQVDEWAQRKCHQGVCLFHMEIDDCLESRRLLQIVANSSSRSSEYYRAISTCIVSVYNVRIQLSSIYFICLYAWKKKISFSTVGHKA